MKLEIPTGEPKDLATLHRWLLEAFRRSGDSYGGRVLRRIAVGTTETRIAHGLAERPLTTFWSQDGVTRVGRTRSDDERFMYLQASTATVVDILVIPGHGGGTVVDIADEVNAPSVVVEASSTPSVSVRGFRSKDQAGAYVVGTSRMHVAGLSDTSQTYFQAVALQNMQDIGAGQMAYAVPEYFERSGVISRLISRSQGTTGNAGDPRIRFGVYADGVLTAGSFIGSPYPGARLGQSDSIVMNPGGSSGNKIYESFDLSIPVSAGTYVWFMVMVNAQAVTNQHQIMSYIARTLWPFHGFTLNPPTTTVLNDAVSQRVGWRHAVTFGTTEDCPSPFPQSAPAALVDSSDIPLIGYGFQQS